MATVADVVAFLEEFAPLELAESWDNVGLLLGRPGQKVERLMTCLTLSPSTAAEAAQERANMVVSHHPIMFEPLQRITDADPHGQTVLQLAGAGIAVYSPHTAFDSAELGINQMLAERIGLRDCKPLRPMPLQQVKIVTFVPQEALEQVSRALFDAGAGIIGEYRECSFRVAGRGTFFGTEGTQPAVGQAGRREEVDELRLEVICPRHRAAQAVAAMCQAHPYEEPAYDVYPLVDQPSRVGGGRHGQLDRPMSLQALAQAVARSLGLKYVQVVGEPDRTVQRVAVACGAGSSFIADAAQAGCDVLVTGEAGLHRQLEAAERGLSLVLAGHYATERFAIEVLAERLSERFADIAVWPSRSERDPARTIATVA